MTCHYPDLGATSVWNKQTSIAWLVAPQQYGISALVLQTVFPGETIGCEERCELFSKATKASQ